MTMHRRLKQLCDVKMEFIRISDVIEVGQKEIDKTFFNGELFLERILRERYFKYFR